MFASRALRLACIAACVLGLPALAIAVGSSAASGKTGRSSRLSPLAHWSTQPKPAAVRLGTAGTPAKNLKSATTRPATPAVKHTTKTAPLAAKSATARAASTATVSRTATASKSSTSSASKKPTVAAKASLAKATAAKSSASSASRTASAAKATPKAAASSSAAKTAKTTGRTSAATASKVLVRGDVPMVGR